MNNIKNSAFLSFCKKHQRCILCSLLTLAVLFICRNLIIDVIWDVNELSWVTNIDQDVLGWLFVAICIFGSCYSWKKCKDKNTIISEGYVCISMIIAFSYLYLRIDGTIDFYKFIWKLAYSDFIFIPIGTTLYLSCKKTKQKQEGHNLNSTFRDQAINSEEEDELGFSKMIDVLLYDIEHTDLSKEAFSIGLVGRWGQGKSSFANLLKNKLDPESTILIEFNPRNSKNTESIAEDFFNNFSEALHPYHTGIKSSIRKYANALQIVLDDNIIGKIIGFISSFSASDSKEHINKAIKEIGRTIYVVVDDLDRLTAKEILETLKLIDRNADFVNTVFITAYDKDYVNDVLQRYLGYKTGTFTDKYFNYEVLLPALNNDNIYKIVYECLDKIQGEVIHNELIRFWDENGRKYVKYFNNIRHIKRFINIFLSRFRMVYEDVNVEDFFNLTLLRYYDIETYNSLVGMNLFITNGPPFNGENPKIIHLTQDYEKQLREDCWKFTSEVLVKMFPKSDSEVMGSTYQRIHDMDYFDLYFYDYKEGKLYLKDLIQLFESNDDNTAVELLEKYNQEDTIGLTRFLENAAPQRILTRDMLKRYLTLALQYRTHCQPSVPTMMEPLELPLLDEGYKIYKSLFNSDDIDSYKKGIEAIYESLIPKYPFELQRILENINEEKDDTICIFVRKYIREKELRCQDLFLNSFDEGENSLVQAFYVSVIMETGKKKCIPEASRRLLKFMNDHQAFAAANIFGFSVNSISETNEQQLFVYIDQIYKNFTLWFPVDNTSFTDWIDTINDDYLKKIILRIYNQPANALTVKALKTDYENDDYEGIWNAIKTSDDAIDIRQIEEAIQLETVFDLSSLCKAVTFDKERVLQLYKDHYQDKNFNIPNRYFRDMQPFEPGDIVKLSSKKQKELEVVSNNPEHIFKIQTLDESGECKLQFINEIIDESDLLPVLVESNEDKNIYYDPIVAASFLAPGQAPPIRHTNYEYYMDHLKKSTFEGETEYDLIKEKGFAYVHEVQHWLRNGRLDDGLKIRYGTFTSRKRR